MKILLSMNTQLAFFITIFVCIATSSSSHHRRKRASYDDLPDSWYLIRNSIKPTFECQEDGYFADVDNECQLFHVCRFINLQFSKPRFIHYTFICGNGTVFNQLTQTCTYESQLSVPCESSQEFFYMNKRIGSLNTWFHGSDDFEKVRTVNNNNRFNTILNNAQNSVSSFQSQPKSNKLDVDDFEDDF